VVNGQICELLVRYAIASGEENEIVERDELKMRMAF
jgi:predicted DNA-binding transcriptional regulator YafY